MDEKKLLEVLEWPVPTKVKQVQAFLGFVNFYYRFIENFTKMSKPLFNLTKKNSTWTWDIEQQSAFETLKKAFTMASVLRIPNNEDPFKLFTNMLWELQTGKGFPCIWILNPKPQSIQWSKDIKRGGDSVSQNHMIRSGDHRTFWKEHVIMGL